MNISEERVLQILRVEEPLTLDALVKFLPGARPDQVDACLWELHRQNRIHRIPRAVGECWYFGGITGGTPTRTECTQAELNEMAKYFNLIAMQEGKAVKLYYHDGNPKLITDVLSTDRGVLYVEAWPALPKSIASEEPVRYPNPTTGYLGVRFFVGKETWVVVGPQITFTLQQEKSMPIKQESIAVGQLAPTVALNGTSEEFKHLPLTQIYASQQVRKFFDAAKLDDLAQSIREKGVIEPIIVRYRPSPNPHDDYQYEIVAGERRYRASKLAEQSTIPALIRDLDDNAALEIQVTENIQRADLHPIEEAYGYQAMRDKLELSVSELCLRLGRSEKYVYHRLKLLSLPEGTQTALWENKITLGACLVIARLLENPEEQWQVTKAILEDRWGNLQTEARIADHIQQRYLTLLSSAPFSTKDDKLLPVAGACTSCTKRTGAQALLFAEEFGKKDTCLDKTCFKAKQSAFVQLQVAKAQATGAKVLSQKEVASIMPYSTSVIGDQYARLDDKVYEDGQKRTFSKLLGKSAQVVIAVKDGELIKLVEKKTAQATIKTAHPEIQFSRSANPKQAEENRKIMKAKDARKAVFKALMDKLETAQSLRAYDEMTQPDAWRILARIALRNVGTDGHRLLRKTLDLGDPKDKEHSDVLRHYIAHDCGDPLQFLFQCVLVDFLDSWVGYGGDYGADLRNELFAEIGFDFKAEMKQTLDAVTKPKAKVQKAKGAKAK